MINISNKNWQFLTDHLIIEKIGFFIKQERLNQNKTQAVLAKEAGINRTTLSQFESGKQTIGLLTLVQILRVLGCLNLLEIFQNQSLVSPIKLATLEEQNRKRASKSREEPGPIKSDWE